MYELKTYVAIIPNQFLDLFDIVLNRISNESNVKPGNRLSTIIQLNGRTVYEVSLTDEEASVIALSCAGTYVHYSEKIMTESKIEYTYATS